MRVAVILGTRPEIIKTPGEIADRLVAILRNPEYRQRLEQNGLDYVRKVHSCENIAAQLEARLKEAIDEKCMTTT